MARALYSGVDEYGQPSEVMLGCAIGDIIPHFGTTPPPGTLVCDGSEVSREAYAELYQEIGALCGPGDGSTTFNLPDLRGRWMMGADAERAAGEEVEEGLPNAMGSQSGDYHWGSSTEGVSSASGVFYFNNTRRTSLVVQETTFDVPVNMYFDLSKSNPIYGASAHVTPESVAVLPCIVYE